MPTPIDRSHPPNCTRAFLWTLFVGVTTSFAGCGGPTVAQVQNARAFEALLTAVSLRNEKELEKDAKLIDERRAAGELGTSEYAEIKQIIAKARAKDWASALRDAYALRERNPAL